MLRSSVTPGRLDDLGEFGPFIAIGLNFLDEFQVFIDGPGVFVEQGVEMVEPVFAALLGGAVVFFVGPKVKKA